MKNLETLLKDYADHVAERAAKGIPPLPLNAEQRWVKFFSLIGGVLRGTVNFPDSSV